MNSAFINSIKISNSILLQILLLVCLLNINLHVRAWGYPEDNCYSCYDDKTWGEDGMYFCRHNSSGLVYGMCCRKGLGSDAECSEMYDSSGL